MLYIRKIHAESCIKAAKICTFIINIISVSTRGKATYTAAEDINSQKPKFSKGMVTKHGIQKQMRLPPGHG